jgi:hypothetical protein
VLNCVDVPIAIFLVSELPRIGTVVCRNHDQLLANGAAWKFAAESRKILIGADLQSTHR